MAIKIFVDQGHNPSGPNTGAEGSGLLEQDVTYAVGVYLADLLRADPRFEVRLSRTSPEQILGTSNATSLVERVRLANEWPADYFISIHCNANVNPAVNGTEVYVYRENTQAYWLAQHVLAGIVARVGTRDNGVRIRPLLATLGSSAPVNWMSSPSPGCWVVSGPAVGGSGTLGTRIQALITAQTAMMAMARTTAAWSRRCRMRCPRVIPAIHSRRCCRHC